MDFYFSILLAYFLDLPLLLGLDSSDFFPFPFFEYFFVGPFSTDLCPFLGGWDQKQTGHKIHQVLIFQLIFAFF